MQRKKLGTSFPTLSPEQAAFLRAAAPTSAVAPSENIQQASVHESSGGGVQVAAASNEPPLATEERKDRPKRIEKSVSREVIEVADVLVADSFKLPQALHRRLLRASSERKLERIKPYTKQDIVASALDEWLSKRGYTGTVQASQVSTASKVSD
jgi:hypothetical protein